ncbi:efflux RND transporter periplasmic adaptor subunit [Halopseudomonas xinjiangensis]|nr:efflux RND transporter periplasmic adaptor subunit [Halopseudomonas xinjiangensis]
MISSAVKYCFLLASTLLVACSEDQSQQQGSRPPPEVAVMTLETQPVQNVVELPGRVEAFRTAEVRARVTGIVQRRLYEEGTEVEAGQELFLIDPREMQANLNSAQAALESAQANATNATRNAERYEELVKRGAISRQEYDTAVANARTARAAVSQAEAAVESAQLSLEYSRVTAPIAGVAGRAEVTEGALVSAAEATLMTRVEQTDPVYVNIAQSNSDLLALRAQFASGQLVLPEDGKVEVRLILENGAEYPHPGYIDFLAMTVDRSTGTVAARAQFPNPDRSLLPGQFVQARVLAGSRPSGILIPQRAVMMTNRGGSVMVLSEANEAQTRQIQLGDMRGSAWVVRDGLEPGERIIVDGWQGVRSGSEVRTRPFEREPTPHENAASTDGQN